MYVGMKIMKALKAVDTIGNCQSLAFTVGVSQYGQFHGQSHNTFLCHFSILALEVLCEIFFPLSLKTDLYLTPKALK